MLKGRTSIYFLILCCLILFAQCKRDWILFNKCIPYDRLTDDFGDPLFLPEDPFFYQYPCFNPNNSDEMVVVRVYADSYFHDLVKYNLKTKEKELLLSSVHFLSRPRWGKNDWILLNIHDYLGFNVYKMKSNGDSLTALTAGKYCLSPEWNITADKLIYSLGYTSPTKHIIADPNGNVKDTVYVGGVYNGGTWQHEEFVAHGSFMGLFLRNPYMGYSELIYDTEAIGPSLGGTEWLDEERVFWCNTTGVYVTNILTRETELIEETCNARYYEMPTYAPCIDKIVLVKLERIKKPKEERGILRQTLVMMNPDGTKEKELKLD